MPKVRIDSWASSLSEEQSWKLYYLSRTCQWQDAAEYAVKEFGLEKAPSRSAFYLWRDAMRKEESNHRLEQAAIAAAEAAALAKESTQDEKIIQAFKAMATEIGLRTGDGEAAGKWIQSACALKDRMQKDAEIKLKRAAQSVKEDELKLARDRFEAAERRENAAKGALINEKLTPEEREARLKEIFGI